MDHRGVVARREGAKLVLSRIKENERYFDIFEKKLEDGAYAYAFFNLGEVSEKITPSTKPDSTVRDLWAKENISHSGKITLEIPPHTVRILKSSAPLKIEQ